MKILVVDDEWAAREDLTRAINNVVNKPEIFEASNAEEAIEACKHNPIDVAFLDIRLPGKGGIDIAQELIKIRPHLNIIMQTAYTQYALDAVKLYVCDFIVKPVSERDIRKALEHLRWPIDEKLQKLNAKCFGQFEVFWNDRPLLFKRKKTKELLAYLIDCNGSMATSEEIIAALWEDACDMTNAKTHLRTLIRDLKQTLDSIGMKDLIIRKRGMIGVQHDMIDCDYYRYLDGEADAEDQFRGEYMSQYSWGEYRLADLLFK